MSHLLVAQTIDSRGTKWVEVHMRVRSVADLGVWPDSGVAQIVQFHPWVLGLGNGTQSASLRPRL